MAGWCEQVDDDMLQTLMGLYEGRETGAAEFLHFVEDVDPEAFSFAFSAGRAAKSGSFETVRSPSQLRVLSRGTHESASRAPPLSVSGPRKRITTPWGFRKCHVSALQRASAAILRRRREGGGEFFWGGVGQRPLSQTLSRR